MKSGVDNQLKWKAKLKVKQTSKKNSKKVSERMKHRQTRRMQHFQTTTSLFKKATAGRQPS